jgi:hypothetical protein
MRLSNRQGGKSGLRQRIDLARGRNTAAFKANVKSLLNIAVHEGDHVACCRALRAKLGHYMIGLSAKGVIPRPYSANTRA